MAPLSPWCMCASGAICSRAFFVLGAPFLDNLKVIPDAGEVPSVEGEQGRGPKPRKQGGKGGGMEGRERGGSFGCWDLALFCGADTEMNQEMTRKRGETEE